MIVWRDNNGTICNTTTVRQLVKRVMDDGRMNKLEACLFVAGMFQDKTGFDVYRKIDGLED